MVKKLPEVVTLLAELLKRSLDVVLHPATFAERHVEFVKMKNVNISIAARLLL